MINAINPGLSVIPSLLYCIAASWTVDNVLSADRTTAEFFTNRITSVKRDRHRLTSLTDVTD